MAYLDGKTRLGPMALPWRTYGSFAGKVEGINLLDWYDTSNRHQRVSMKHTQRDVRHLDDTLEHRK